MRQQHFAFVLLFISTMGLTEVVAMQQEQNAVNGSLGQVRVDTAYWAPDRGTPYRWFEGAPDLQEFFTKEYKSAGYLCAYIKNESHRPITPTAFYLNGQPLEKLREEGKVVWWRLLPRP
ncbi:MAG: hypothetical protein ACK40X_14570, partial [Armatimonadota bacterium]